MVTQVAKVNPPDSVVRRIIVGYDQNNYTEGFKMFDVMNNCVLEIGRFEFSTKEFLLEPEDRIVGFRSRLHVDNAAYHNSLVIVIARRTL